MSKGKAEPKWLALARGEIGQHEVHGEHDNPVILRYYADAGRRLGKVLSASDIASSGSQFR